MLFNSFEFLLFFPIFYILYWFVFNKKVSTQNILILISSYFFYAWWDWRFLGLLALSTILDYTYGFYVNSKNRIRAKIFLWLSIINNLGILAIFKYYNFFALQFQEILNSLHIHADVVLLNLILPIGISFYTFHGMSYIFDIYNKKQVPIKSFVDYSVFVSFFPLLVAGPIERANHLLPQIQSKRTFSYSQSIEGCKLIIWGLFKKVVIADSLASIADLQFNNYESQNWISLLIGVIAFSFQIYGDFSGYSDIAMGISKLLGIELLSNFKFPYFSRNIAEFWRRWHISLSSWFRDYVYIPLGGSKNGNWYSIRNVFIIFLLSGFWHGASWNFIIWGFIHACGFLPLLILNRNRNFVNDVVAQNQRFPSLRELFQMMGTFAFASFAWIFFRIKDLEDSLGFIKKIAQDAWYSNIDIHNTKGEDAFIYILVFLIIDWSFRKNERELNFRNKSLNKFIFPLLAIIILFYFGKKESFIYFQF